MDSIKNLFYVFTDKRLFIEWILEVLRDITLYFLKLKSRLDIDSYTKEYKEEDMRVTPSSIKKHMIYDENVLKKRWDLCSSCEFLTDSNKCTKCGCYMKIKHKLAPAKCPIGKWDAYTEKEIYGISTTS